jgi:hypothetical protein
VSPVPPGKQGELEQQLKGLAEELHNLGLTATGDVSKDYARLGVGKDVGMRVYAVSFSSQLPYYNTDKTWNAVTKS